MIEVLAAKSGDRTLSLDGKLLASRFDPRREAERWCDQYETELLGIKSAIIVGAGAGYHLSALKKRLPHLNIICIEFSQEVISCLKDSIEMPLLGIELIKFNTIEGLFENSALCSAVKSSYRVLTHNSAKIQSADTALDITLNLNGRIKSGLKKLYEIRFGDREIELKPSQKDELYTLYDLTEIFEDESLRVARELVK